MSGEDRVWMQEQCFIERSGQIRKGKPKSKSIDRQSIRRSGERFKSAGLSSINKTDTFNTRERYVQKKKASGVLGARLCTDSMKAWVIYRESVN